MNRYAHVIRAVTSSPWYVLPEQLEAIAEVVAMRAIGERPSDDDITVRLEQAAASQGPRNGSRTSGVVAVLPVYGTIFPRANLFSAFSGGATVDGIRAAFRQAMADESVGSLVMEFDSPGGQVDGIEELATEIREARGRKPIVAVANTLMASAAYYLAAQADEIVASPSSIVGSIGVVSVHMDHSRRLDAEGITPTMLAIPPAKVEGNAYEPLADDARDHVRGILGDYYDQFVHAVSRGRGVPVVQVRGGYGEGRVLTAKRALAAGMVDRIDTLDATIRRLQHGRGQVAGARAAIAAAFDVPETMLGDGDTVGLAEQAEANARDGAEIIAAAAARLELDRHAWLLNS